MPLSLHAATNRYGSGEAFQLADTGRLAHLCNMDMGVHMSLADSPSRTRERSNPWNRIDSMSCPPYNTLGETWPLTFPQV